MAARIITCVPKTLNPTQLEVANRRSIEINPDNAQVARSTMRTLADRRGGRRLVLLVGNRWPATGMELTVQFLDNPLRELRSKILLHMNAWNKTANIRFTEVRRDGQVRIARLDDPPDQAGYWSYVGTQILGIEADQPTLNLEGFTVRTSNAEFTRVVRHEAGHTLGFDHEHMRKELVARIDRKKAFAYFKRTQGWSKQETIEQVLTPLSQRSIIGTTEADPISIMCYEIPGEITTDGKPIRGGTDINDNDFLFAGRVYPKQRTRLPATPPKFSATSEPDMPAISPEARPVAIEPAPDCDTFHIVILDDFDRQSGRTHDTGSPKKTDSDRPKFARVFASYCGARVAHAMQLRADKGEDSTPYGRIIRAHERIKNYTDRARGSLPTDDQLIDFGSDLFEALFQGDLRRLYDEARAREQNRKLDLVLTSMIPWIAEKPWEFAYDAARRSFLATEDIHLVRNVLTAVPASTIVPRHGPLRILVASAQPVGFGKLSVEQEVDVIRRGFQPLVDDRVITIEVLARTTPGRIQRTLSTGDFTIVHFIGHGMFDQETEEGSLFFEDEFGSQVQLGERSVREIFCKRGVSLVFLNACQTGSGGQHDFNKGVAQALVSHGLPAVVANQYSVLDTSATAFAQHFYWALAQGMSIGSAACESRIAVNCALQGEPIDWAVPVVYARDPNVRLCVKPDRMPAPTTAIRPASKKAIQGRSVRVAFWDIDNVFPSLEQTLQRMNCAQSVFGFELAALSVPLDVWDRKVQSEDGTPYLWAEKLAKRLERMTVELRVNILACVTRHWLRDNDWFNLYAWWPTNRKPPVVIFSCAGFDQLAPEGLETDRVIANATVSAIAGFLSAMDSHGRGPKNCPFYFDDDRDFTLLTGRQEFHKACRDKLQRKIPHELAALEAILGAFF